MMEADFEGISFKGVQIRWYEEHERSYLGDWQKENEVLGVPSSLAFALEKMVRRNGC